MPSLHTVFCLSSYKEQTDDETDPDDVVEWTTEADTKKNDAETIEKILHHRVGKKGGNGRLQCIFILLIT